MNDLSTFLFDRTYFSRWNMVVAGICADKYINILEKLPGSMEKIDFPENCGPFEVDYTLALHLKNICHEYIYAIGVSISLPYITEPCGGIIGNPHKHIMSASKHAVSSDIENGISVAALPGGPGIALKGTPKHAEEALSQIRSSESRPETLRKMISKTVSSGIKIAAAVTDGTGPGQHGCCMVLENNKILLAEI